ncbi:MAG: hypothetical protein MJ240_13775 [Kiritimatiellae bacterium]|nr:hypothetical protein [Kiritimatiellia bacterium]
MKSLRFWTCACTLAAVSAVSAMEWNFEQGLPTEGKLRGTAQLANGGLVPGTIADFGKPAGFTAAKRLTPPEAFRFTAEFTPGRAWTEAGDLAAAAKPGRQSILFDDMYVTYAPKWQHQGIQVAFTRSGEKWASMLFLGFSNATEIVRGPSLKLKPGVRTTFSFVYDGNGGLTFDFAGQKKEVALEHVGPIYPAKRNRPQLGDRVGGNYWPFDGVIHRIALDPIARARCAVTYAPGRRAFRRGEEKASVSLAVRNFTSGALTRAHLKVVQRTASGTEFAVLSQDLADIATTAPSCVDVPVVTNLKPGWMTLEISFSALDATGAQVVATRSLPLGIGPRHADRMTALMWGFDAPMEVLADLGFTHGMQYGNPGIDRLDQSLVAGVDLARSTRVELPDETKAEDYMRRDRKGTLRVHGKKGKPAPEVSNPAFLQKIPASVAADVAAIGSHPAYVGVLPSSEHRDGTFPSFTTEHLRYKAETGRDVPPEVELKTLHPKKGEKLYPTGVVPDDDPILAYYRWFWSGGDGWPSYTGTVAKEYRARLGGKPFTTFWDPAVRCPPRWGSGGAVDMINQWVYAVPEPMNVAGPAEEMLAMAAGTPGQRVSIMTQLICYRTQIAPTNIVVSPTPEWVSRLPRADFPTIPPDTLQEATWSMIAKPVQAIMYHGWGTIYDTGAQTGYAFTCPASTKRLQELLTGIVRPLGPVLKKLGRTAPEVAVFESFTTCAMGGPASWGWKAPAITFLQRARLDPRVVYEETILRDGLAGVKVLYAPQCRFLTPTLISKIKAFQSAGGILVADDQLVSALKPDVVVPVVSFDRPPESDHTEDVNEMEATREGDAKTRAGTLRAKAKMVAQAEKLRTDLAAKFQPQADSSSPEIVVYSRRWKDVDYVFAINDKRTFGDYVGMWGLTMEKGLPFAGTVTHADPMADIVAVYELSRGGAVPFTREGGKVAVPVSYETNDGRLLLFAKQKIARLAVDAPKKVARGASVRVSLAVLDDKGKRVNALLPVEVRLYDAAGRELDGAGALAAEGGVCTIDIPTNLDDAPGNYRLVCRDRASGLSVTRVIAR